MRIWNDIIHVVGRGYVKGALTPFVSLEIMISVRFAILIEVAKQRKSLFRK
jgi:hypothetical protein